MADSSHADSEAHEISVFGEKQTLDIPSDQEKLVAVGASWDADGPQGVWDYLRSHYRRLVGKPFEYKSRGSVIELTHHRACTLNQLVQLGNYAKENLSKFEVFESPSQFNNHNDSIRITFDDNLQYAPLRDRLDSSLLCSVRLYSLCSHYVKPLTVSYEPKGCSWAELVGKGGPQPPSWFTSDAPVLGCHLTIASDCLVSQVMHGRLYLKTL